MIASTATSRSRVLMFAYYFPPLGGGGVQRTLKFVKYLPAEGFDPIVVSGGERGFFLRDTSLSEEVPAGTPVLRARALPLQQAQWKVDGLLRRARLPTGLVNEILWPDGLIGWLPSAVWRGLRAVREHRPQVLYSTALPMTAHLAAMIVHRLTGLPWVADFRDGWTLDPVSGRTSVRSLARARAKLERSVISRVSYVTVVDESIQLLGLPSGDPRRVVISNGVDPDDLNAMPSSRAARPASDRFCLSYLGSLYGPRDAGPVFAAIRELIASERLDPVCFELRIIGHASLNGARLDSLPVTFLDYMDHSRAITEMSRASALLFYQPPSSSGSSGKIYEYLTSGRQVLCVAHPDNLAYRLVEELGAGVCADARDSAAVAEAIESMVADWQRGGTLAVDASVRTEVLRRFSRPRLTADLAEVLRAASAKSRQPGPATGSVDWRSCRRN